MLVNKVYILQNNALTYLPKLFTYDQNLWKITKYLKMNINIFKMNATVFISLWYPPPPPPPHTHTSIAIDLKHLKMVTILRKFKDREPVCGK